MALVHQSTVDVDLVGLNLQQVSGLEKSPLTVNVWNEPEPEPG